LAFSILLQLQPQTTTSTMNKVKLAREKPYGKWQQIETFGGTWKTSVGPGLHGHMANSYLSFQCTCFSCPLCNPTYKYEYTEQKSRISVMISIQTISKVLGYRVHFTKYLIQVQVFIPFMANILIFGVIINNFFLNQISYAYLPILVLKQCALIRIYVV